MQQKSVSLKSAILTLGLAVVGCASIDQNSEKIMSDNEGQDSFKLVYSKDYQQVVIGSFVDNQLVDEDVIVEAGGEKVLSVMKPSWSKDGDKIAYMNIPMADHQDFDNLNMTGGVCVVQIDGGGQKCLTSGLTDYIDFHPTWYRDGSNRVIAERIKMSSVGQQEETPVMSITAALDQETILCENCRGTSVLIDGTVLAAINKPNLGYITAEGKKGEISVGPNYFPEKVTVQLVSVSPDEAKIAFAGDFTHFNGEFEGRSFSPDGDAFNLSDNIVYVADFDKTTFSVTNVKAVSQLGDSYPRWSPDSKKIAYMSQRDGGEGETVLVLYDLEGEKEIVLTEMDASRGYPSFENSPM